MDTNVAERVEADLVGIVDRRRLEGVSVAAACREAGISSSTYYRRRRTGAALAELANDRVARREILQETPPAAVGLLTTGESKHWPFPARAPFYWDQVFVEELSDSFVRREFGRGPMKASGRGALTALAALEPAGPARRLWRRLRGYMPRGGSAAPLAAAAMFALVAAASVWAVSVAADPAAWINPAQTRLADSASDPTLNP